MSYPSLVAAIILYRNGGKLPREVLRDKLSVALPDMGRQIHYQAVAAMNKRGQVIVKGHGKLCVVELTEEGKAEVRRPMTA